MECYTSSELWLHITFVSCSPPAFSRFGDIKLNISIPTRLTLNSAHLQVGDDSDGILGFLVHDIKREIKRGKSLRCHLCNATSATLRCGVDSCLKTFHLPCLLRSGGLSLFYGAYDSFCQEHRPSQQVPKICWAPPGKGTGQRYSQCGVCLEKVALQPGGELSIWTPCCKAWFHRDCVVRFVFHLKRTISEVPLPQVGQCCRKPPCQVSSVQQQGGFPARDVEVRHLYP